jgi:hypothetical protein
MDNSCLPSLSQELVPEVIPSKKRHLNMAGFSSELLRSSGYLRLKNYLGQGCTDPGSHVAAVQRVVNGPSL